MTQNPPNSPSQTPPRYSLDFEISIAESQPRSKRPSSLSALSDDAIYLSNIQRKSTTNGILASGSSTPDTRHKIENASPDTAKYVALRMYEALKKHGLKHEAGKLLSAKREIEEEEEGAERNKGDEVMKSDELVGMDYLMKDGLVDYLRKMASVLPAIPQQIVRFQGIKYSEKIDFSKNEYETFGSKLAGCIMRPLEKLTRKKDPVWLDILKGVDGYIMPGSMTLVLGHPGSGKSTLLEILASTVDQNKNTILQGKVMYNNKDASEVCSSRLIAYVSGQMNKHIPFLSVRETLEFARDCTQRLRPENLTPQMRRFFAHALVEGQDPFLENILEILNLKKIENQLAGEAISDTDRQKLTTAELAVGSYSVMIYDQPVSGCDLAVTYELVNTVRTISRIQQSSAIMSLTQLSEEVFDLFDRIILLSDGQVVFQGPRKDALHYFSNLGYKKPLHLESAEFLEDIAAGKGYLYAASESVCSSLNELAEHYRSSSHYQDIIRIVTQDSGIHTYWVEAKGEIGLSIDQVENKQGKHTNLEIFKTGKEMGEYGGVKNTSKVHIGDVVTAVSPKNEESRYLAVDTENTRHLLCSHLYSTLQRTEVPVYLQIERSVAKEQENQYQWEQFNRPYIQTWWQSNITLIRRQIKIAKRLHIIIKLRLIQAIVLGIFSGSLFHKLGGKYDQQKMNSVRALGFVSTMSILLINLVQLPLNMLQRPVFYKHKARRFFRVSSYVFAHTTVNIPQTIIEAMVYNLCMYFLAGLSSVGHGVAFYELLLLFFLVAYFGSSLFFLISAVSSILEAGNALAGLLVSILLLFSGFVIYPSNIPAYFKWLVYINPIHWANVSFCRIQFQNYTASCSNYEGILPFCENHQNTTVGKAYLLFYELYSDSMNPWLPYVIILGWILFTKILALLGLKKLEYIRTNHSLPHRTYKRSNFISDIENDFLSSSSCNEHSTHHWLRSLAFTRGKVRDNGGVDKWVDEFRLDIENSELQVQVVPAILIFEDCTHIRYDDKEVQERKTIFSQISGYAEPRDMIALLGGTQTCKSKLLQYLVRRIPSSPNCKGNVQIYAKKLGKDTPQLVGYVEKLDAHQPYLSVLESLQFSAALRLGKNIGVKRLQHYVEMVLDELDLLPYSNQLVGSLRDATGRTYEVAKKLTIGVELAANPSILFLEEPIDGLDTTGTLNILMSLDRLSESGRTIIATLTYPNMRSLSFFNRALILTREGHQAFFGPLGANCSELLKYFSEIPRTPRYLSEETPINYVMDILGQGIKGTKIPSEDYAEIYRTSSLQNFNNEIINQLKKCSMNRMPNRSSTYSASYLQQLKLVSLRTQKFLWRNVQYTYGRLTACILIGFLMGSLYFKIEYKDIYGVTSRSLYIYMQVMLIGVVSANNVIPQIGTDRLVYFREKRARMYLPILYPFSWAIGEIPYFLVATLALVGIGNGMAGIGTGKITEFIVYWLVLFLFTICVTYFGMMVTFLASVPTFAAFLVSVITSMWVSASGVVVVLSDIKFYKWMYWSNPFQYAMNTLTSISFYCGTHNCRPPDCMCAQLPDGTFVWDRLAQVRSLSYSRIRSDVFTLLGMSMLFAALSIVFFASLKHNKASQAQ